jgi:hypothetical protein
MFNPRKLGHLALTLLLPMISACNEDGSIDVTTLLFRAPLDPVNLRFGTVTGTVEIRVVGNQLTVQLTASGLADMLHVQFIQAGNACPTMASDTNGDLVVDGPEALAASGLVLLPLDGDLTSQTLDTATSPVGTAIAYTQIVFLSAVNTAVHGTPSSEFVTTIPAGQEFNPDGLAVLVYGVADPLLITVGTIFDLTSNQSVPVACGVLESVVF